MRNDSMSAMLGQKIIDGQSKLNELAGTESPELMRLADRINIITETLCKANKILHDTNSAVFGERPVSAESGGPVRSYGINRLDVLQSALDGLDTVTCEIIGHAEQLSRL